MLPAGGEGLVRQKRNGKYIGVSGERIRCFTHTLITPATVTSDSDHCSWAAQQKIGLFLFFVMSPKVAKARTYTVAVANVFAKITSPILTIH
jgi:hypothetical protein